MKTEPHHSINSGTFDPLIDTNGGIKQEQISAINKGLTKREYFAAMAMMAQIQRRGSLDTREDVAVSGVKYADALIKALNETKL